MKKFFKYLVGIIVIFIAIILISGLFITKEFNFEKTTTINANSEKIWHNISTLKAQTLWMPWMKLDPKMKSGFRAKDGLPGAQYWWESEEIGKGSMTIFKSIPNKEIDLKLKFIMPFYESSSDTKIMILPQPNACKVTWTFHSVSPYPWNVLTFAMNPKKYLDKDFGDGLQNLKSQCEN